MRGPITKSYFKMLLLVCGVLYLNVTQMSQTHTSTPHHTHYKYIHYYNTSDFFFWLLKKRRQKRAVSTQMRRAEAGLFWLLKKRRQKRPISMQKRRTQAGLQFWLWRTEADLSHEFLGGEDQFVVDEPARVFLEETGVGVHHHCLLMLHRLVLPAFPQPRRVVEIARRDCLVTAYNQNVLPLVTHTIKMYCLWWHIQSKCIASGDTYNQNVLPLVTHTIKMYCLWWHIQSKCIDSGDTIKMYCLWWHIQSKCIASGDTVQPNCIASGDTMQPNCIDSGDTVQPNCTDSGDTMQPKCILLVTPCNQNVLPHVQGQCRLLVTKLLDFSRFRTEFTAFEESVIYQTNLPSWDSFYYF